MNTITLIVSLSLAILGAARTTSRCDGITPAKINYTAVKDLSPYYIYRTTIPFYNCSTVSFIGPAPSDTHYSGTCLVINGGTVYSYDVTLENDSLFNATQCSDGANIPYSVMFSNLKGPTNASFCVYTCDASGQYIEDLNCPGRTPNDEAYIQNYLDNLKVPIKGTVFHSQQDCQKPKSCVAFS